MGVKKKDLDKLIADSGVSTEVAAKLHAANGTSDSAPADKPAPKRTGGHGPSTVTMPHFGDI